MNCQNQMALTSTPSTMSVGLTNMPQLPGGHAAVVSKVSGSSITLVNPEHLRVEH